jgi:hypothetical protein
MTYIQENVVLKEIAFILGGVIHSLTSPFTHLVAIMPKNI